MVKKFLTSVADVCAYDENDVLLFSAKTLLDSSIETSVGNTDVRAGRGHQLQYVFYNTAMLSSTLTCLPTLLVHQLQLAQIFMLRKL